MRRLVRMCLLTAGIVALFRVAYPDSAAAPSARMGIFLVLGALGVGGVAAAIETSTKGVLWAIEGAFVLSVLGVLGTRPHKDGIPLQQLLHGRLPAQAAVRRGVRSLGLRDDRLPGSLIVGLFPK